MPILILVAGGSASGKTTVIDSIKDSFKDDIAIISMDNYYNKQDIPLEQRRLVNYDHPSSFDMPLLKKHIKKLLNNEDIDCPIYDFKIHNRTEKTYKISSRHVIILEGILALYDEEIRNLASILVFVEADEDIRFIRRLKRDINERDRSVDDVIRQYLDTVKPMYNKYIAPTKEYADIIILNNLKYECATEILKAKIAKELKGVKK